MFNKESGLVKVWVRLIQQGTYEITDVPKISNLRDLVIEIIYEGEE